MQRAGIATSARGRFPEKAGHVILDRDLRAIQARRSQRDAMMRTLLCVSCLITALGACAPDGGPSASAVDLPAPLVHSSRRVKSDVRYIDDLDAFALRDDLVGLRLATFHYTGEPSDAQVHLGFIVEDSPTLLAVDPQKQSVDLYSYVSMAVAAIQVQKAEIEQLHEAVRAAKDACVQRR
jgi:hypothetical protein